MLTKEDLHIFAAAGVAQKIAAMEEELAAYHAEWPELFLTPTAPRLLKVALNGHGRWSAVAATTDEAPAPRRRRRAPKRKRVITEAHRRKLSRLMKQRHANGDMAKARARAAKKKAAATNG